MKTIVDAVNELMGDLINSWAQGDGTPILLPYLCFDNQGDWVMTSVKFDSCVCTTSEFNALVAELQNWQLTKNPETGDKWYSLDGADVQDCFIDITLPSGVFTESKDAKNKSKFERDIEIKLFGHQWIVGIVYDSFDTLHEFDIQSLSLRYPENTKATQMIDLTSMLDSCSSLYQQFECAVIAKLEEERQNV